MTLFERFSKVDSPFNELRFYDLNFSPAQVFEFVTKLTPAIRKNQKRIFTMRGYGKRLIQVMNEKMISQNSLSKKLDISQPEVSYYMRDRITPRPIIRQKMAFLLNVNYAWLSWHIGENISYENGGYPVEHFQLTLAERIVFFTWWNKMSVKDLSDIMGVSNTAVQYWMDGTRIPSRKNLKKLADYYKVDEEYLRFGVLSNDRRSTRFSYLKKVHSILKR